MAVKYKVFSYYLYLVEPRVWYRNFPKFLFINSDWGELLQGQTLTSQQVGYIIGQLAVGKSQKNFDLSAGQLSRGIPAGIVLSRCRIRERICRKRCMLSPAIWLEHFYAGNWFGIAYPLHLFFPLDLYFPPLLQKELDNLLPQGSTLPFQYVAIYIFTNQQKLQNHHLSRRFTVETFGACITYFLAPLGLVSCVIFNTQTPMISYILLGSNVLKSSLLQFYRSLCGS